ncbi:hypothetical protein M436DRAFT_55216 [Aureobasidium namibiae CBS 147.97]|uniref:Zn(2)-C6 fungal-type domain-containing protein n=1 Tax=Aureobasidium namibiae CBS 147.97 TaxID=1043004 RepID=A0A074WE19_9PEZI|nr:uncharacterized protein M436DRAFT_55216 [Aureobasidium namibiae CBS 147.97]KEQ69809.1 hypothetical protein M436DRAFT_55216 [Aureobasidium namibiae CBS 147.97]
MTMACIKPEADIGLETKPTVRKRRRRTTTAGAADDCFMCQKRNAPCDRRRPYCGQCLEIGKDCSGYKTTLTWGVGIASRGKLRGLTCPVAEKTDGPVGVTKRNSVSQSRRKSSTNVPASERPIPPRINLDTNTVAPSSHEPLHTPSYGLLSPLDAQQPIFWQPLQQYANPELPSPTSPYDNIPLIHQRNPAEYPLTPVSLSYNDGLQSSANYGLVEPSPASCSGSYPPPSNFYADQPLDAPSVAQDLTFSQSQDAFSFEPTYNAKLNISIPRAMATSLFYHLSPRMQYLLNYYDKHICSVLVAFDDTINPYRMHILQLATHNEGLQNALAALSLNNMRMRLHKRAPVSGFIEELDSSQQDENNSILARPTPEESYYKSVSIGQLQAQLADAVSAQDDSVLAILLILCLFHVSDSGFSKFKTQLEGVQRLLSMRDPGVRTGFIGWVEMFFAWFDVMTSTVNDRETEIQGDRLDMLHYSSNLGALEQFSGCDGRLFKLIARLGRLNLLSQSRPVRPDPRNSKASYGATSTPKYKDQNTFPTTRVWRPQVDPVDFSRLDGNGWGALLADLPEDLDTVYREASDTRQEFWKEWHDIRSRLETWSMDSPCLSPTAPDTSAASLELGQRDLTHINESFRSSALLYTERLAHPFLPSSSPKFQAHVRNALSHIAALDITSCVNKFLLWPLFISGTECVDAADQALVRDRCIEVQIESGFFNNLSVLDVLEKVWAENDTQDAQDADVDEVQRRRDSAKENGDRIQAFRWRKAMDRVDGEYLVI